MASNADFVHCHLHTEYSFLDGANKISKLMERASEYKMPAISMTDHGNLCGAVEFYTKAKEHGIKPIIGCEAYVAPGARDDKNGKNRNNHLILLAKNETGYRNLCKLTSEAFLTGFYYNPRIDKELLKKHSEGLIGLSACLKGEISYKLSQGDLDGAKSAALEFAGIFEPGCFHLEIQENGLEIQKTVNAHMCQLSKDTGIPLAATADCHYLEAEDSLAHKVLMYIGMNRTLEEGEQTETDLHFKGGELAAKQFSYAPQAVERTLWIAEQCNFEFPMGTYHMPRFDPPEGVDLDAFFVQRAREGLAARIDELRRKGVPPSAERVRVYEARLAHEIEIIKQMGFPGYFLIVSDFIQYAKRNQIPVGPGRGSAAGSLVAWAMRITEVDPIPYDLLFERFLNPGRRSMPDIDVDFCMDRRGEVIDYITKKYGGSERVAQIITYGKLKARAVVRDVGRVLGLGYGDVDKIAKLIPVRDPDAKNPLNVTLTRALEMEPRLREMAKAEPKVGQLLDLAQKLEGLNRHAGMHAAGVVIGDESFSGGMPLYKTSKDEIVTQFDMGGVESLGYIKFDFLGLKTLTMIRHAEQLVRARHAEGFEIQDIPLDDKRTYDRLCEGDNIGVFQLESGGMRDTMKRLKPRSISEISDILALYRPGPMDYIPEFADRKLGRAKYTYLLPDLQEILGPTNGIIVYQEQIIQIVTKICGFSMADADLFRRAIGKKKMDILLEQEKKFMEGALAQGHPRDKAKALFDDILKFANYGFNKSHSVSYAFVTYQTAYLKTHYPHEFMAALLTSEMDNTDKLLKNVNECNAMGIEVLPPDLNESEMNFTVTDDNKIRFGLKAIKGVGESAIEAILESRARLNEKFTGLYQFCEEVDLRRVNRKVVETLVKAGAFDFVGTHRARLFEAVSKALETGQSTQRDREMGQESLFGAFEASAKSSAETYPDAPEWSKDEKLAYERECLGCYLTEHPLNSHEDALRPYVTHDTMSVKEQPDGREVRIGILVGAINERRNKRGELFAKIQAEDQKGSLEVFVGAKLYEKFNGVLKSGEPVVLCGNVTRDPVSDTVEVRANEFIPLSAAREKLSDKLELRIDTREVAPEMIDRLGQLLNSFPGRCPARLFLTLPDGSHELVCELDQRVAPSVDLLRQLSALSNGIRVVGP